jgi:uncharacterized protein
MNMREQHVLEKYGFNYIGVFGSFARNEPFKDIDILIEEEVDIQKIIQFKEEVERLFGVKVDVMIRRFAEPIVLKYALKDVKYVTAA